MKPFTESMRYEYDLNPNSVVFDVGVYEGNFSKTIAEKYNCFVWGFEPIREFYARSKVACDHLPKVTMLPIGLGPSNGSARFGIKGDSTGFLAVGGRYEDVELWTLGKAIWQLLNPNQMLDLLKLNIEAAEFDVLDNVISIGLQKRCLNIQVQPHPIVENCEVRWAAIREALLLTHEITYEAPWCWTNFKLK